MLPLIPKVAISLDQKELWAGYGEKETVATCYFCTIPENNETWRGGCVMAKAGCGSGEVALGGNVAARPGVPAALRAQKFLNLFTFDENDTSKRRER